ncbi:unnamed protein product [Prorocentrum cordatum]|uniref:Uncharacterized protein n=1 Tax=Prorocentrum cordatum TaxID=2364126 RepID=A0ABN9Y5T9_9DINO|nr:unnamed protein product [Polarella glacialis]
MFLPLGPSGPSIRKWRTSLGERCVPCAFFWSQRLVNGMRTSYVLHCMKRCDPHFSTNSNLSSSRFSNKSLNVSTIATATRATTAYCHQCFSKHGPRASTN